MHIKDFERVFLDEYILYVCYGKSTIMLQDWDFKVVCYFMYYAKLEGEYACLEYELDNMDEYVRNNVKSY